MGFQMCHWLLRMVSLHSSLLLPSSLHENQEEQTMAANVFQELWHKWSRELGEGLEKGSRTWPLRERGHDPSWDRYPFFVVARSVCHVFREAQQAHAEDGPQKVACIYLGSI